MQFTSNVDEDAVHVPAEASGPFVMRSSFVSLQLLLSKKLQLLRTTILNLTCTRRQTKYAKNCSASPTAKFVDLTCMR